MSQAPGECRPGMGTGTRNKQCIKITFYFYSCCVTLSCEEFQTTMNGCAKKSNVQREKKAKT